jgi:DNA-binding phage protein
MKKDETNNLAKWELDLLFLKKYARKQKLSQDMIAQITGFKQQNVGRILNHQYSPSLKTLIPIVEAMGLHIEYVPDLDPVLAARQQEINDLFQKHFNMDMPKECRNLTQIMTLVNKLHFKHPTWYDAFAASILDIWRSYDEEITPEETNI